MARVDEEEDEGEEADRPHTDDGLAHERAALSGREYCDLTGQTIAVKKTYIRCSDAAATIRVTYKGHVLARRHADRVLGAHVRFDDAAAPEPASVGRKFDDAGAFVQRAQLLPLPAKHCERIISAAPVASALYGCEVTDVNPHKLTSLRVQVGTALMPKHARRCPELLLTLFAYGHRTDPVQVAPYRALMCLRRILSRRPEFRPLLHEVWALRQSDATGGGPAQRLLTACKAVQWRWTAATCFTDADGGSHDCLALSADAWAHRVRAALRLQQWRLAQARRAKHSNDIDGIQPGIDRRATLALHDHRSTDALQRGFLKVIICGGVYCFKRLHEAHPDKIASHCPFCSSADDPIVETTEHIWVMPCSACGPPCVPRVPRNAVLRRRAVLRLRAVRAAPLRGRRVLRRAARDAGRRELERADRPDRPSDGAPADHRSDLYPWGWSPPPPHHVAAPTLRDRDRFGGKVTRRNPGVGWKNHGRTTHWTPKGMWFPYGATMFKALMWWLGQLKWPRADAPHASDGITFAELAIDFEVSTGVDLPPTQKALALAGFDAYKSAEQRRAQGSHAGTHSIASKPTTQNHNTHALWDAWVRAGVADDGADQIHNARSPHHRAQVLEAAWKYLSGWLSRPIAPGAAVTNHHAGGGRIVVGIRALGSRRGTGSTLDTTWAGWTRRPIFVGGAGTEEVLRSLPPHADVWNDMGRMWEPSYDAVRPQRRAAAARFRDVTDVTDDTVLPPPTLTATPSTEEGGNGADGEGALEAAQRDVW
eukprot:gene9007-6235_t